MRQGGTCECIRMAKEAGWKVWFSWLRLRSYSSSESSSSFDDEASLKETSSKSSPAVVEGKVGRSHSGGRPSSSRGARF